MQSLCKTIRNNIKSIRKSIENHPQIEPQNHMQIRTHTTGRSGSFSWRPPRRSPQGRALENASSPRGRVWRTAVLHGLGGKRLFPKGPGVGERAFSRGPLSENARSPRPGWDNARYPEGRFQRTPVLHDPLGMRICSSAGRSWRELRQRAVSRCRGKTRGRGRGRPPPPPPTRLRPPSWRRRMSRPKRLALGRRAQAISFKLIQLLPRSRT